MTNGRSRLVLVGVLLGVCALGPLAGGGWLPRTTSAACAAEGDPDTSDLFSVSPAPIALTLQGTAPYQVVITFVDTTLLSPPLTMSFTWGDGATSPVTIVPCGNDLYNVTAQQLSHTYNAAGQYPVQWHLVAQGIQPIESLAVIVAVSAAEPTPVPATPTSLPVPTPVPAAATPTAGATAVAEATATLAATPSASPSAVSPTTPTVPPTAVAAAVATSTPTPVPQAPESGKVAPPEPESEQGRPETIRALPEITGVSTDRGVIATNLVLAGVTIWVFFSSVLFNQTMQSNREEVSGWFRNLRRPGMSFARRSLRFPRSSWVTTALVLFGTAVIYEFLDPGFGVNEASVVLFFSVLIGVGVVGLSFSALEAWSRERTVGVEASVQAFPLSLAVAAASVLASRLLDLQPGVIYGFAASCVVVTDVAGDKRRDGRALMVPVTACLVLSIACWLLVGPARGLPGGWLSYVLEATAVVIFIGGLEGLLINLLPLDVMDGAKIYRWNRFAWGFLLAVCAFLFWHVLLNTERSYFSSLRQASSLSVLLGFLAYTGAGVGLWAFFRFRPGQKRGTT